MKKQISTPVIFAAIALASQQAWGLGFGRVVPDAVLGQLLVFTAPVHVEAGEHFGAECVSAEVYFGDTRVNPADVRTSVERGAADNDWLVRISTLSPVSEPVVEIALSAGCDRRFVRRFTAFADPPTVAWSRAAQAQAQAGTSPSGAVALAPQAGPGARPGGSAGSTGGGSSRLRPVVRKGPTLALAQELNARSAPAGRHPVLVHEGRRGGARVAAAASEGAPRLVLDGGYARLKLDMEDPVIPATSPASAAAIAAALADLDDPATQQLRQLEQSIQAMKRDSQATRDQTAKLQAQLAQAQSRNDLVPWLAGGLLLALAGAVALALQLRRQARLAHSAWFNESQVGPAQPPASAPEAYEAQPVPTAPVPPQADMAAASAPVGEPMDIDLGEPAGGGVVADMSTTMPLDRAALAAVSGPADSPTARELSVEELLDLEQQADFFIALGQEDAAVDLLMSHLRSAGGQSPLPYTKLLEIYRRQGDRSAYERTRARFNRRFNAYAPDWDTGPTAGRTLEDYPETIAHIQAVWNSPIDAMASLEAMLFKRDDTSELFDLPAYRDVLLLYSLARDLWQLGGGLAGTQVDVLLPLDDPDAPGYAPAPLPPLGGLDLPLDGGEPASFEMTGYEPPAARGEIDLQVPMAEDGVHATLDEFGLEPADPVKPPSGPGWHDEPPREGPDRKR